MFYKGYSTMRKRSLLLDKRTENRLHSLPFLYFFFKFFFFLMWTIFEVIIEFATILLLFLMFFSSASFFLFVFVFFLSLRHVRSELPNHRSNLRPLHWKAKS